MLQKRIEQSGMFTLRFSFLKDGWKMFTAKCLQFLITKHFGEHESNTPDIIWFFEHFFASHNSKLF
ncbi:hypothetical protein CSA56_14610 [candidate division KSB3 bacterium]|uniref:Uncharacterized protein n=1 Tax=candidate division KSB3 bacterium TaxID=2044937 RepID=A0A2G6KAC7_9BACT|nr:MAG: hypothetical protein CSA56_14610 [candidate division KSB3 bacterium]